MVYEKWWFDEDIPSEAKVIKDRDIINSKSMYLGDEAFIDTLDRLFDPDISQESGKWQRMQFNDVRQYTGLSSLTTNSKVSNQAKRALRLWSLEVSGREPAKGKGIRAPVWYHVPPFRDGPDPEPPEIKDDVPPDEIAETLSQIKKLKKRLFLLNKQKTKEVGDG